MGYECPKCGKPFKSARGVADHSRDVHGEALPARRKYRKKRGDRDESFADRAIRAQMQRDMGELVDDDWLLFD
ncbi:MAG: hypothetical protein GY952_13980 [Rhodobacteraceae bacterium]|nr:hypothetical protein [Paracoccaceae bacterium]